MKTFLVAAALTLTSSAYAAPIAAEWTTTSAGTLNGVEFLATGFGGVLAIFNNNFTGPDYAAAPVGISDTLQYGATSDWTVTFDTPVNDLMLLLYVWRGSYFGPDVDDPTSTYTFNQPFSILSGLAGASVAGNTLSLPDTGEFTFYSGIFLFPGSTTTLSIDATGVNPSGQGLTFAVDVATVPEPGSAVLLVVGLLAGISARTYRNSRA